MASLKYASTIYELIVGLPRRREKRSLVRILF